MENLLPYSRFVLLILLAFSATAVASISLQNLVWIAVLLFFFAHWQAHRKVTWPTGPFALATLIFLATFLLGALVGIDPANSFHTVHKYLAMLMLFPLGAMALRYIETRKLLLFFLYGAAFCAVHGLWNHYWNHQERIDSFSGDKMVFGGMLMVALLLQILFLEEEPKDPFHWISFGLLAWALLLTETRGAWLGFIFGFALLMWRFGKKWLLIGLAVLCVSYFFWPKPLQDRVRSMTNIGFTLNYENGHIVNANQPRYLIWIAGWRIIQDHPWGVGQGNLERIYPAYRIPNNDLEPTVPHLHDNFLQVLVQNGWVGLAAYLFWIISYYWMARKFKADHKPSLNLNWAFLCVFSAVLIWGVTEYTFSHQFMNIQFFLFGLQSNLWANGKSV